MNRKIISLLFISLFFIISCKTTEILKTENIFYAPEKDCIIYSESNKLLYKYKVIAQLKLYRTDTPLNKLDLEEVVSEAASIGAEGVINIKKEKNIVSADAVRLIRNIDGQPARD